MTSNSISAAPSSASPLGSSAASPAQATGSNSAPPTAASTSAPTLSRDEMEAQSWRFDSSRYRLVLKLSSGRLALLGHMHTVLAICETLDEAFAFDAYPKRERPSGASRESSPRFDFELPKLNLNFEGLLK